jgi:uncharacterized protein with von Willebrand factor type A (vWA) domain
LTNDTFQSFYGITPRYTEDARLTTAAHKLHKFVLDDMMNGPDYGVIKSICEGRELPAMEATGEFTETLLPRLDELLQAASGQKESLNVLEKLEKQRDSQIQRLMRLLEQHKQGAADPALEKQIIQDANKAESKAGQADTLSRMVDRNLQKNADAVKQIIRQSTSAAKERAEFTKQALLAWGDGDSELKRTPVNLDVLSKVRNSPKLRLITRFLGRYKETLGHARKNSYAFGRGEKYDLEYGNRVDRALTSELALLASPETVPLFLRKAQSKRLKQYRRREAIVKGSGDMIVCLDESGSTFGEPIAWGRAVALSLLELCRLNKRTFALVHFAKTVKTDVFRPGDQNLAEHIMEAAETFLGGGTDFEQPLRAAADLVENKTLDKPDVVFVTDGVCNVAEDFKTWLMEKKKALKFTITGVLLDSGGGFEFSLHEFCERIYRASELSMDEIAENLIKNKI